MAHMDEILNTSVPTNVVAETAAAAAADHRLIMDGDDEALEKITIGITLGADAMIEAGREATAEIVEAAVAAEIVVAADVDDMVEIDHVIALETDLAVTRGIDQDRAVTREKDPPNDQVTRGVIAREIDLVNGLYHEIDPRIDLIDPATVVRGMAEKATNMVEARGLSAAEVKARPTHAKIARAMQLMGQLRRTAKSRMISWPTGVGILEGGAVGAEAVEETERKEKRVVMSAVEAVLLALPTARGSKKWITRNRSKLARVNII